ncbi:MAG: hypothetical protein ACOYBW_11100 [Fluviibacter phosphoraccumulans]
MYYFFFNAPISKEIMEDLLVGASRKNTYRVNYYQASQKHYDAVHVFDSLFDQERVGRPLFRGSITVCASDMEQADFFLLKHSNAIVFHMKVDGLDFLNENQASLVYQITKLTASSVKMRKPENIALLEKYRDSLRRALE